MKKGLPTLPTAGLLEEALHHASMSLRLMKSLRTGPGQRTVFTIHKKAGESRKEREWAFNGGGRIRPSMAGRTDSSERMA